MSRMSRRHFQAGALSAAAIGGSGAGLALFGEGVALAEGEAGLLVPARTIPVPNSISKEAQAFLAGATARIAAAGADAQERDQTQAAERAMQLLRPRAAGFKGAFATIDLPHGAKLYRVTPDGRKGRRAKVAYFDIHGGGFTSGGGEMCQVLAKLRAMEHRVEVFSVDYRLAPRHPYPAGLDDTVAAYREVLNLVAAKNLVVAGSSAGGNLAAALMLRARAEGLPLPAGLLLLTPGLDMTGAGDTRQTNKFLDINLYGGSDGPGAYAGQANPGEPHLSPIYGEIPPSANGGGWPPTLLSSGTRDLLLSDTVRMHRKLRRAGVRAELHLTEAGPHGGFMGSAPEDFELMGECRRFCREVWKIGA
jgi:epsilon-lactone hydrolase